MEGVSTNSLRVTAPKWSLAGDNQLLNLLQNTHQKILSKCRDVNSRLEEMASALDGAAINLQNVNNKFMALSNSQFIESRVYDDDADVTVDTRPVEVTAQTSPTDEISMLKASLAVVERAHETAEILDDSDTDSDTEISMVLKPKDMYSHRPLPHIIGTQAWKNKWHAGLVEEDSDTDSSVSKQDRDNEQYSDSEEEMSRPPLGEQTLSESSSSLPGSLGGGGAPVASRVGPGTPARPADVAAALARRLAGDSAAILQEEREEYPPTAPAQPRKIYKPEVPASSAIFSDEPPPLEELSEQSSEEDIFAEINKHTPYTQKSKVQDNLAEDLFSFEKPAVEQGDIFSDFANTHVEKPSVKPKSTLFEGESEPELFAEPFKKTQDNIEKDEPSTKKPVGGISLFGSNKGTESIGAAILKRNQRKLSSSGDESGNDDVKILTNNIRKQSLEKSIPRNVEKVKPKSTTSETMDETDNQSIANKEKDIFDDLFSKPEKMQKKTHVPKESIKVTPVKEKVTAVKKTEKTNVKDLFSDNLFDDIDDIFTSNITIPAKESNKKSIFEDDDLFSEIDVAKTANPSKYNKDIDEDNKTNVKASIKDSKSIFDSDDELFSDSKTNTDKPLSKNIESYPAKNNLTNDEVIDKNIYCEVVTKTDAIKDTTETNKKGNFMDSTQVVKSDSKSQIKSKNIFDSDSDDDIFATLKTPDAKKINNVENSIDPSRNDTKTINEKDLSKEISKISDQKLLSTDKIKANPKNIVQSPSLFEEDEIDDLFIAANKLKTKSNECIDSKLPEIENILSDESKLFSENIAKVNEINHLTKSDNIAKDDLIGNAIITESTLHLEPDTTNKLDPDSIQGTLSGKNDTFDDNLLENDLFSTKKGQKINKSVEKITEISEVIESSQDISEIDTKRTELQKEVTKPLELKSDIIKQYGEENVKQSDFDEFSESAKEKVVSTELKIPIPSADIFGDIISEPPAFEKPAEPKKSKNINALFDDDSDDESLFFKKDDAISDEKPDIFSKNANFDIFVDEPPAIDVDFATKPARNTDIDEDLFSTLPKLDNLVKSSNTAKKKEDIFCKEGEEESISKITDNIIADDRDELFNALPRKENVPKFIDIDNNVPVTEEVVPDNVRKEIISDNKPKVFESKRLSNLFAENEDKDLFSPEIDKSIDNIVAEKTNILSKVIIESDDELFASLPDLPTSSQKGQNKSDQNYLKSNVEKTDECDDVLKSDSPKKDADIKKIGKLNTKKFNINVNALMPGASPKKIPKEDKKSETEEPKIDKIIPDETDFTPKDKNDVEVTDHLEPKTEKSVTFNGKTESGVLDNNVSKQRPKIQVKRRPSTRKARHEAVRKSAIDFGDDTDNSSSFDEPKARNDKDLSRELKKYDISHKEDNTISKEKNHSFKYLQKTDNPDNKDKIEITKKYDTETHKETNFEQTSDILESMLTNLPSLKDSVVSSISTDTEHTKQNIVDNFNESKQTTTKIVYILNDEDIFNTESKTLQETENIFKSTEGIKTLGNTYKENTEKKNKKELTPKAVKEEIENKTSTEESLKNNKTSIFDDSDEELFNKNKKPVKNTTIFDSDSEEDLFSGKKSTEKKNKEVRNREVKERKQVVVKGSLFGDDDDDDDLFGVSVKKDKVVEPQHSSTTLTSKEASSLATTASKSAEPVFEDPLSMLGDDY